MPGSAQLRSAGRLNRFAAKRFMSWVDRRIPPARQVSLHHGIIFILPTLQGAAFLLVLAMMFVAAINYESSLAFALVFLLLSMFLLTILYTFRNLSGLRLSAIAEQPAFAGTAASFVITVERDSQRVYEMVGLRYSHSLEGVADLIGTEAERVTLQVDASHRGWLDPGRLRVETLFPFGLMRAWSLIDLKVRCLVYPRPLACDLDWLLSARAYSGQLNLQTGNDDFTGLREYAPGDSLKHIAWKNLARGQGLFTKQYSSNVDERIWLDWEMFPDMGAEERLSHLCYCVLELDARNIDYGVRLPGEEVFPAKGPVHSGKVLEILALYRQGNPERPDQGAAV